MGAEYDKTRHNIGFDVLDHLASQEGCTFKDDHLGDIAQFKHKGRAIYLLKPSTFMNLSGKAVRYWVQKLSIAPENWLVIVDEFQFDIGEYKLQKKGSDGGHNGLKSIQQLMNGNTYPRLRVGIGHNFHRGQQVEYVLGKWKDHEWKEMQSVIDTSCNVVRSFACIGLDKTMNTYNKKKTQTKKEDS
ncbi:UNVERIFIED_CONTAM: hypothetical protein GTU68_007018 [Idotea baltica]|nr:hypothetical protein [Idotea baltica]